MGTIKRTLFNKNLGVEEILKCYNTMAASIMLYGEEIRALNKGQERRLEATDICLFRPLEGYILLNNIRNEDILQ